VVNALKKTPLSEVHEKLGAKMVEFGGWWMPVQYTNVIDEHITTRTKAGLFDICHMGEFEIRGKDSLELIQKMVTNDISKLADGKATYAIMCYDNGTVVDDLFIYRFSEERYMLVVNAGNIDKDFDWIRKHSKGFDVRLDNISGKTAKLDVQGPRAGEILQGLTSAGLKSLKRFFFVEDEVGGVKAVISRTGYTAEDGFELYFDSNFAEQLWNRLLDAGRKFGMKPAGLGARDTLRIEACYSLYGHEINENITPVEAGLSWLVKPDKGNFIGKSVLEKQLRNGTERTLVCFEMTEHAIPREHYDIVNGGVKIGFVTSGTFSPTFRKGIGMGLVTKEFAGLGQEIEIAIRDKNYKAKIVKRPFYEYKGGK
jgi:aminomethyltransferase